MNVDGNTTLDAVTMYADLDLNDNADISGTLDVHGATTLADSLTVQGATTLNDTLKVNAPALLNDSLNVAGGASFGSNVTVDGATALGGTLNVTGNTSLGGTLGVTGVTSLNDSLHLSGGADFDSNVNVDGNTTLNNATVSGTTTLQGELTANAEVTFNDTVHFSAPALFSDSADFAGNVNVGGTMEVTQLILDGVTIPALDNTDALPEGDTNLYFTAAREAALQAQLDFVDSMNTVLASTIENLLNQLFDPATSTTTAATPVVATTATLTATFDDGGAETEAAGFVFSTNPTLSDSTVYTVTPGDGSMSHALSGLTKGTTYYYMAFVETIMGRAEGAIQSFTTIDNQAVTTLTVNDAAQTTANLRGSIASNGGGSISASGVKYGTSSTLAGASTAASTATSGTYTRALGGLAQNTTNYYHAYVTNEAGTASEDTLSFATLGPCQGDVTLNYWGYTYDLVEIGSQCWFAENLQTTKYNHGVTIPSGLSSISWSNTTQGAVTFLYEGTGQPPGTDAANVATYGRLFNGFAANSGKLCSSGWHVPADAEWTTMKNGLGGYLVAGGKLKASSGDDPAWDGSNLSGFSGLPGRLRDASGLFGSFESGYWWTSTFVVPSQGLYHQLNGGSNQVVSGGSDSKTGMSVRCVRN